VESILASGADRLSAGAGLAGVRGGLAGMIDHTLLKPTATRDEITTLCDEAKRFGFASVCIQPCYVSLAAQLLRLTNVKVCTVAGFPLGANRPDVKAYEAERAIADGAHEVDMVANIGALKSRDDDLVERDVRAVVDACRSIVVSKVIIEAALLTDEEKVRACRIAKAAGADFVKTSTGFFVAGGPTDAEGSKATPEVIDIMVKTVGGTMGVKASGGVRDWQTAVGYLDQGCKRLGVGSTEKVLDGGAAAGGGDY
jgi:deoxyribose-phosphate aldolase